MAFFHFLGKKYGNFQVRYFKKRIRTFVKEILPALASCGNCGKFCCDRDRKFSITSRDCREQRCKSFYMFESSKDVLLSSGDENSKKYVSNFINDFLGINEVAATFFNVNISDTMTVKRDRVYNVKSYTKSKKNRVKVFNKSLKNHRKIEYNIGGTKHHFFPRQSDIASKKIVDKYKKMSIERLNDFFILLFI